MTSPENTYVLLTVLRNIYSVQRGKCQTLRFDNETVAVLLMQ